MLQPINVGRLLHAVAVTQLEQGRPFETSSLRETVDALISPRTSNNHRQAIRQRVVTALVVYRNELVPEEWRYVTGEAILRDVKVDLIWSMPGGELVADELKTGNWPLANFQAITRQCETQCAAGREVFGESFRMVRLVVPSVRRIGEMRTERAGEFQWR